MWKGHLLEILGLGLIVTAFTHYGNATTAWVNVVGGGVIALIGTSLWNSAGRRGFITNILGLTVMAAACIPPLTSHSRNIWLAAIAGGISWIIGHGVVASESGGPWRLKDRPIH